MHVWIFSAIIVVAVIIGTTGALKLKKSINGKAKQPVASSQLAVPNPSPKIAPRPPVLPEPDVLPSWISPEDFKYHVDQFRANGFRGPTNWYRNLPNNNSLTPQLEGKRFSQPAAFVAGAEDDVLLYDINWRDRFVEAFEDLRFLELIDGAAHWLQVEKPLETTAQILRFLKDVS